jgi:hypothetical protein
MKIVRIATALALIVTMLPLSAVAQRRPGGGGGGGSRPAPAARPAPAQRPAAPAQRPAGGFNFNNDTRPNPPARPNNPPARPNNPIPAQRPSNPNPPPRPNNPNPPARPPNNNQPRPPNNNQPRPPNNNQPRPPNPSYRPPNYRPVNSVIVVNPVYRGPAWGWNRGLAWYPAPAYWGGGFWGTLAIAATSAAVFGYIYGQNNQQIVSYQVQPNSPGAQMLANYQLTQTPCGPPNLVVIYGPDNSVICAYPNNLVSAGTYSLDPSTLTISSY